MTQATNEIRLIPKLVYPSQDFNDIVEMLTRPYVSISKHHYDKIYALANRLDSDFLISNDDRLWTFGNADGGYALMPLLPEANKAIKAYPAWQQFTEERSCHTEILHENNNL